jgi:hypothetical protein
MIDQTKDLYRDAVRAVREDEMQRADELATAAHDAARGLVHALRADAPLVRGMPLPPVRDSYEFEDLSQRTSDRLEEMGGLAPRGPGRTYLDAARRLYDQARQAGREDKIRAIQLVRAADAWTHVCEHLTRADSRRDGPPAPELRRERPQPPKARRPSPPS